MKPHPFIPQILEGNDNYIRDLTSGQTWHRCTTRVLYADTDRSQVVYHANYLKYFELGRASLMREAAYPYKEIEASGYIYPIIEIGVKYFTPIAYDDQIFIHTQPGELERVRLQFEYIITQVESGQIVCKGFTRHCAVNSSNIPVAVDEKTIHLWNIFPR